MGFARKANVHHRMITDLPGVYFPSGGTFPWSGAYCGAMSIPGAYRAAVLLSDLLGSFPWKLYHEKNGETELMPTPPLLQQPNPPETRMNTFSSMALDLILEGNAIAVIAARDPQGTPTAAIPVPARFVGIRRDYGSGAIEYSINVRPDTAGYDAKTYSAEDVIHVKGPCEPGALRGFGVLEAHLNGALELSGELQRQARNLSVSGVPTGVIGVENPDATEDDLKKVKAGWLDSQRDRTVAVLNATTKFQPLSWNPEELELVEARKMSLHEIALIFGLPLSFLGVETGSLTYSNVEQEGLNLLKYTLPGHLARFEQALSQEFPRDQFVMANLDSVLRADTLTRYQAHEIAVRNGWLRRSEVREIEDLPPVPGIDDPPPNVGSSQPTSNSDSAPVGSEDNNDD